MLEWGWEGEGGRMGNQKHTIGPSDEMLPDPLCHRITVSVMCHVNVL